MTARGRTDRWWLLVLTTAALGLRIGVALLADRELLGFNDQFLYHHMAEALERGDGYQIFGEPTLRWPPAYPFLLAVLYRFTGVDATAGFVLSALLSTAAVPIVFLIGRRAAGRSVALVAAAIVALLPGQWLFAATLLTEPLAALQILAVLALAAFWGPGLRSALVLGALVAFGALTRGEGMLLVLLPVAAWWARETWRRAAVCVAGAGLVALALVAPWLARNERVAGERVGISLNSAETLYSGHNPEADGGATYAPPEVLAPAADIPPGPQKELAHAELLRAEARRWALDNPGRELELIPLRLLHLLEGDGNVVTLWIEAGDNGALGALGTPLEVVADVAWYAFLAAFALAAWRSGGRWVREPWARAALVLPALALGLYGVALYGNFRYRVPYEPLLALLTAAALVPAWEQRRGQGLGSNQTATVPRSSATSDR
jgi:4-amino-4-deoxy-L-arabinose transferase-like glycosyltransferase